jgi:glycosyltransferase involved in cell wall biosynthesis
MEMKNVFYIANQLGGGSAESLVELIRSQQELGVHARLAFYNDHFVSERLKSLPVTIQAQRYYFRSWLTYGTTSNSWTAPLRLMGAVPYHAWNIVRLIQAARSHETQIVHTNCVQLAEGGLISKILRIPHIWHVRELLDMDHYQYSIGKDSIAQGMTKLATFVACNSKKTANSLKNMGVPQNKLRVIYNIIEPTLIHERKNLHNHLDLSPKIKLVGIVGWLSPLKKVHQFIEMAAQLSDLSDDTRFLIIGPEINNPPYSERLRRMVADSPRPDSIIFTGTIKHMTDYISSLDVLVSLCEIESFGRTVAEALASGTPAVGIAGSAVEEIIDHDETGYLVKKDDIEGLAEYVRNILEQTETRSRMAAEGISRMKERFNRNIIGPELKALYSESIEVLNARLQ